MSILQGLGITAGLMFIYWEAVNTGGSLTTVTSMIFVTLITANIFLTLMNRSFRYSMLQTLKYKNRLMPLVVALTITMMISIFLIVPWRAFFGFELLAWQQIATCVATGIVSVVWVEVYKWRKRVGWAAHSLIKYSNN
jgi:Ca2+-transporting ATPase